MYEPKLLARLDQIMRMVINHELEENIVGAICDLKSDIRYEDRRVVGQLVVDRYHCDSVFSHVREVWLNHPRVDMPMIKIEVQPVGPKPDRCSGLEYVEPPPSTWVLTMMVNREATHGDKPPKVE